MLGIAEADQRAHHDDGSGHRIGEPDQPSPAGVRIDATPIDIVDEVGGRRIQRRGESRDECGEKSRDDQAEHAGRREPVHGRGQDAVVVARCRRRDPEIVEVGDGERREARDHQVADRLEHHRDEAAHQRRLAWRARREDLLHVVVGRGTGGAHQHALEQQHHHEGAEQRVAVARDAAVERGEGAAPVEVERPAEERRVPARGSQGLRALPDRHAAWR